MNCVEHSMKYLIEITQKIFQKTKSKRRKMTRKKKKRKNSQNSKKRKLQNNKNKTSFK